MKYNKILPIKELKSITLRKICVNVFIWNKDVFNFSTRRARFDNPIGGSFIYDIFDRRHTSMYFRSFNAVNTAVRFVNFLNGFVDIFKIIWYKNRDFIPANKEVAATCSIIVYFSLIIISLRF